MIFRNYAILCHATWVVFTVIILLVTADSNFKRKLSVENVTCTSKDTSKNNYNLMVIKAEGDSDMFYHLWSSTGSFVVMTVRTSRNSTLHCDEEKKTITFDPPPLYSFALILTEIIEIDNSNSSLQKIQSFSTFKWNETITMNTDDTVSAEYSLLDSDEFFSQDDIKIKLTAYGYDKRSEELPCLVHTANSSMIEFILNHAKTVFDSSQFGMGFYVMNADNSSESIIKTTSSLIDDEYTPGVFKIIDLSPPSSKYGHGGYIQWKPILYTAPEHGRESSSIIQDNPFMKNKSIDIPDDSIAYAFYADKLKSAQYMNVTFGMPGENYGVANYSSWTFSIGYGVPPVDQISTVVIIIITVGLGIPVLLILGGSLFVFIRRCKVKNDDLSLSN